MFDQRSFGHKKVITAYQLTDQEKSVFHAVGDKAVYHQCPRTKTDRWNVWTWLWWTSWWCVFERCVCPLQSTTGELLFFKKQKGLVPRKSSSSLTSTVVLQVHAKHLWQCPAWQHDQFPWQRGQKGSPLTWPFGWQTKIPQQESQFLRMEPN